jgi:hypothetical protein
MYAVAFLLRAGDLRAMRRGIRFSGSVGGGRIRRNFIVRAKELLGATNFPRATMLAFHAKDLAAGLC